MSLLFPKHRVRFVACAVAVVVAACLVAPLAAGQTADRVRQTGVLRVGVEASYPPFNFIDADGALVGFDVDIAVEVARRLGVEAEFRIVPFTSLIPALQRDEIDVVVAQMSITPEREQSVDFTAPYTISRTVLVVRADERGIAQLSDLAGRRVSVTLGTTYEADARKIEGAVIVVSETLEATLRALLNGSADAALDDELTIAYQIAHFEAPLRITPVVVSEDEVAIAVKKGNEDFIAEINRVLGEMLADGTYRAIHAKWFGVTDGPLPLELRYGSQ